MQRSISQDVSIKDKKMYTWKCACKSGSLVSTRRSSW